MSALNTEVFWRSEAKCAGMDPNIFFPGRGDTFGVARAKQICASCPVKAPCREYAVTQGEEQGIWGGVSSRQIRLERSQRRKMRLLSA